MSRGLPEIDLERARRLLSYGNIADSGAEARLKDVLQAYVAEPTEARRLVVVDHLEALPKARQAELRALIG